MTVLTSQQGLNHLATKACGIHWTKASYIYKSRWWEVHASAAFTLGECVTRTTKQEASCTLSSSHPCTRISRGLSVTNSVSKLHLSQWNLNLYLDDLSQVSSLLFGSICFIFALVAVYPTGLLPWLTLVGGKLTPLQFSYDMITENK